ncbi:MAG: paraquat-inducible protein A [Deltaproteobacteria bacterium]|nr:paraquat-inducible protein A [Deltaproteobacteria bacterium]
MSVLRADITGLDACPGCDLLYHEISLPRAQKVPCPRCGTILRVSVQNSLDKTLAMSLTGLLLFIPAMIMPIMTFTVMGLKGTGNVIDAVVALFRQNFFFVGTMVLLVSVLFPLIKLALLFHVAYSLKMRRYSASLPLVFRAYKHVAEWGMVEVYMLGILVSIIKMFSVAAIQYNLGFFCFIGLVLITVASSVVIDEDLFWKLIEQKKEPADNNMSENSVEPLPETALQAGLIRCEDCGKLVQQIQVKPDEIIRCPRCRAKLHHRKPASISRTWALVLASAIFYLPANILPIMRVDFMGTPEDSTILDGIIYFFQTGEYFVGGIILTASVLVPLFKIVGIMLILSSIHFHWRGWLKHKAGMFRFVEFIGRWSFLDIFVIALLGAMVRFGSLTTIEADPGAPFFTAVVLSTMFAALAFDPRIMWDTCATPVIK